MKPEKSKDSYAIRLQKGPPKPSRAPLLTYLGIGATTYRRKVKEYNQFAEEEILRKYASIPEPELRRLTSDVINFLEAKASNIDSASSTSIFGTEQIGEYHPRLGGKVLRVKVDGASTVNKDVMNHQSDGVCNIDVNFNYQKQDNPNHRFDGLLKDVSKLAGLMPLDYDWENGSIRYTNLKEGYEVTSGWVNGKISLLPELDDPNGLDLCSYSFRMGLKHIPAFLEAVRKIKHAMNEPEKFLEEKSGLFLK